MLPLVIPFPNIDPVAFSLGPVSVKWYGLAYAAGLLLGWLYVKRLLLNMRLWPAGVAPFSTEKADDLLLYMTLGVVLGGRIGYVLFYKPAYFFAHPADIIAVWSGGMSFHGGFLGSLAAILFFAWHNSPNRPAARDLLAATLGLLRGRFAAFRERVSGWTVNPLSVLDVASAATPIGLFFGRLANFVNGELWGRPSDVAWAMIFPDPEARGVARHPSQLYEASLEGALLFIVLAWLIYRRGALKRPGLVAGIFTAGYGIARSVCELFREPDFAHWATVGPMTAGILYSLPMIAAGLYLAYRARTAPSS